MIACLINFSAESRPDYRIGLPTDGIWREILNTDISSYDGSGDFGNLGEVVAKPVPSNGYPASAAVTIPPLAAVWLLFEHKPSEEQLEPEKTTVGIQASARHVSSDTVQEKPMASDRSARRRPARNIAAVFLRVVSDRFGWVASSGVWPGGTAHGHQSSSIT
jgi:1,4-alpha-glucan branching enzyme